MPKPVALAYNTYDQRGDPKFCPRCAEAGGTWVIRADVAGRTDELVSYGSSAIVDPDGRVVQSARQLSEDLIIAEIDTVPRADRLPPRANDSPRSSDDPLSGADGSPAGAKGPPRASDNLLVGADDPP
ncbi:MAG TPA: nitrilase-related carbon-nitrogen hydrolase [Thermoanaerobaculia bacterium]|nr:nitrilase-related carbon-nitrogen hydrolase [Thermoanaerobaculia bacterium]